MNINNAFDRPRLSCFDRRQRGPSLLCVALVVLLWTGFVLTVLA